MCGICGIVDPEGVPPSRLEAMNAALVHRGPDDHGAWIGAGAGLAMRRLSIIDLAGGRQPMSSDDGRVVVVFNGEIYNFRELRAELEALDHFFRTQSDTEVVLRGYEAWGDGVLTRLNGMFAIAIYDQRDERLMLARDRAGIKPLFYAHDGDTLVFASELGALLQGGVKPGPLNAGALDAYFTFLYIPAPDTIYANILKLLPAEKLVFRRGRLTRERYWQPRYQADSSWTLDSASERFLELLDDSVRLQRVADVPLGAFLSGGLDSSAVVSSLCRVSDRVKTFTIGFDDAQADELKFARIAARHFGTEHTEEMLRPDLVSLTPRIASHFGEPFADSSALPTWIVSEIARRHVTVALSGDGGDELFAGYTWTRMALAVNRYRSRVNEDLRNAARTILAGLPASPWFNKVRRFNDDSFLEPQDVFRRRQTCFDAAQRSALYQRPLAAAVMGDATNRFAAHARAARALSLGDGMLYHDFMMYLPDDILTKVDRMSMAHSLEARVPLLDHRLIEFAATVPFAMKLRGRTSKYIMKHALRARLPKALLRQRKQGFAIPIHRWFREELRDHFQDVVLSPGAHCVEVLRADAVRAIFDAHISRRENYGHHLWALLMFEHWSRQKPAR